MIKNFIKTAALLYLCNCTSEKPQEQISKNVYFLKGEDVLNIENKSEMGSTLCDILVNNLGMNSYSDLRLVKTGKISHERFEYRLTVDNKAYINLFDQPNSKDDYVEIFMNWYKKTNKSYKGQIYAPNLF